MDEHFNDEERSGLEDYGFTNDQIDILESFGMDKAELYSEIERLMDGENAEGEDMTPDDVMNWFNENELPQQGGKRKSRKNKSKKNKKTRKSRKNKRSRKSRR